MAELIVIFRITLAIFLCELWVLKSKLAFVKIWNVTNWFLLIAMQKREQFSFILNQISWEKAKLVSYIFLSNNRYCSLAYCLTPVILIISILSLFRTSKIDTYRIPRARYVSSLSNLVILSILVDNWHSLDILAVHLRLFIVFNYPLMRCASLFWLVILNVLKHISSFVVSGWFATRILQWQGSFGAISIIFKLTFFSCATAAALVVS